MDKLRDFFAPIIIRFQDTDGLKETLDFLGRVDKAKIEPRLVGRANRVERLIAIELVRRGVKIWEV